MSNEQVLEMMAKIAKLQSENEMLKQKKVKSLTFKVSEKGAVSVYNLNSQFPVTLYKEQWERLLDATNELKKFIADNTDKLSVKQPKK